MFATDRDLLILEPNLFRDLGWISQRRLIGTADIAGNTLTITSADTDLAAAAITEGHVALVDATPYEIIERLSPTTATISRLRVSRADPILPPAAATGRPVVIHTFAPQIATIHAMVLRMLGIEPEDPGSPGRVVEEDITNPSVLIEVEALGAIYLAYSAAAGAGVTGDWSQGNWTRAQIYRDRFGQARARAAVHIDLDGDGIPDATRRMNLIQFIRS